MHRCYNCGCGQPDDDHGQGHAGVDPNDKTITTRTFESIGDAFNMSEDDAKKHTKDLLGEEV